jgi:hypothetical protein
MEVQMSAKISAARAAAFLKALGESGNQTLAAERAKVSRSWVVLHRGRDADFDAAVKRACLDFARHERERRKWKGASPAPPAGWRYLDGHQLVVRGTGGAGGGKRVQIARARLHQWDPAVEDRFLAALASTCNAKAACAAAGMSPASAYGHRQRWPGFARRWDEAIEIGSDRLEFSLIEAADNLFSGVDVPTELAISEMTAAQAVQLLQLHRAAARGGGRRPGRRRADRPVRAGRAGDGERGGAGP